MSIFSSRRQDKPSQIRGLSRWVVALAVVVLLMSAMMTLSSGLASAAAAADADTTVEVEEAALAASSDEYSTEELIPAAIAPRSALGLGVNVRMPGVPFVSAGLYSDDLAFTVEGIAADHSMFGFDARTRVIMASARYRVPIAWHDWRPFADVGLVSVQSHAAGVDISAQGFTVGTGVERRLGDGHAWHLRGEARYVRLLDESHWLVGIGLEWRLGLPDSGSGGGRSGRSRVGGRVAGGAGGMANAASVSASGSITGVSLPVSASGQWDFSADLVRGTASVSVDGYVDGEGGSYGFSNARQVSFDGTTLTATFVESDTHEGKSVRATISVSASPSGFSLSIDARRSDGLSASAGISGTTSHFEVVPLEPEGEPPAHGDDA